VNFEDLTVVLRYHLMRLLALMSLSVVDVVHAGRDKSVTQMSWWRCHSAGSV